MSFEVSPKALKRALAVPLKVAARKSTKRIFECCRLTWGPDGGQVQATDLEWAVTAELDGVADGNGVAIVPVSELASLSKLKAETVRLSLMGSTGSGPGQLLAEWTGKRCEAKREIELEDPEQFPELPEVSAQWDFDELGSVMAEAIPFCGKEAARFVLNGIAFTVDGIVSTDGRRLYRYLRSMALALPPAKGDKIVAVPPIRGKLLESLCAFGFGDRFVTFRGAGFVLTGRLMDGTFPEVSQIIPGDTVHKVTVDADAWQEAIEAVEPSVSVEAASVVLEIGPERLAVSAAGGDSKSVSSFAIDDGPADKPFHRLGFNPAYLREFLKLAPNTFGFSNRNSAAIFNGGPRELVLMPVLID